MEQMARRRARAGRRCDAGSPRRAVSPLRPTSSHFAEALRDARESDPETFENLAVAYARASHLADRDRWAWRLTSRLWAEAERELLLRNGRRPRRRSRSRSRKKDFAAVIASLAALPRAHRPLLRGRHGHGRGPGAPCEPPQAPATALRPSSPMSPTWARSPRRSSPVKAIGAGSLPAHGMRARLWPHSFPPMFRGEKKSCLRAADALRILISFVKPTCRLTGAGTSGQE